MRLCKKIWLKCQIRKYEKFLLEEGMQEAADRGKNIQFGLEGKAVISDNPFERIYLPQNVEGKTDISPILALGAERHQEEVRRYIIYQKMLKRSER
ncbi:MAG: hypothetical protein AABW83_03185 [Nanoarchaeota archaeon]